MLGGGRTFIVPMKTWLSIASVLAVLVSIVSAEAPAPPRVVGLPSRVTVVNLSGVALTDVKLATEMCSLEAKALAPGAEASKTSLKRGNCSCVVYFREGGAKHQIPAGLILDEVTPHDVRVEIRPDFTIQVRTKPEPALGRP